MDKSLSPLQSSRRPYSPRYKARVDRPVFPPFDRVRERYRIYILNCDGPEVHSRSRESSRRYRIRYVDTLRYPTFVTRSCQDAKEKKKNRRNGARHFVPRSKRDQRRGRLIPLLEQSVIP